MGKLIPAHDVCCLNCGKRGQFQKVCLSAHKARALKKPFSALTDRAAVVSTSLLKTSTDTSSDIPDTVAGIDTPCLLSLTTLAVAAIKNLELALVPAAIKRLKVTALLDSGASELYLSAKIARCLCVEPSSPLVKVMLAFDSASTVSDGFITSTIKLA